MSADEITALIVVVLIVVGCVASSRLPPERGGPRVVDNIPPGTPIPPPEGD